MAQKNDGKTVSSLHAEKRGRGRPKKGNALSDAERAKRYRDNKRNMSAAQPVNVEGSQDLDAEVRQLRADLAECKARLEMQERQILDIRLIADLFVEYKLKNKSMPNDSFQRACTALINL